MATFAVVVILRVSVLLAAAALFTTFMRRSSAAARHLVWTCALVGSLAVPALSFLVPAWELPMLPAVQERVTDWMPAPAVEAARQPSLSVPAESTQASDAGGARPAALQTAADRGGWRGALRPVSLWVAGMLFVAARLALGTFRMRWLARRARPVGSGRWLRLAERIAAGLGVANRVIFLEGNQVAMPMTWGVLTSRVLLPASAESWPPARQRVVLIHELAHVKRRDCLTQLVAQLACAVYWFNPLAWLAARRLRAEREHACDDVVLAAGTRGSDYADHLIEIARSMRSAMTPTWAAVAMAHRSQLEGRLMAILDPRASRRFPTRPRSIALVACMIALTIPIALVTPAPRAAEAVPAQSMESPPMKLPLFPATPASPSRQIEPGARAHADSRLTSAMNEALRDAIPDAAKDLAREGWFPPIVFGTSQAIGSAVGEAVAQGVGKGVAGGIGGGITGGVKGGIADGVKGGVPAGFDQEAEREVEREVDKQVKRDPRAVAALVEALKDTDAEVRESAMQALAHMRAPEALDAIRGSLKDANPSVRQQAAFALGQYRDRGSVDALGAVLQDSSADVREQAVFALGQIRDPRAGGALTPALKDSDASVREQAAFALGQLRSTDAVEPLSAALRDQSADVREQAAFALGQIRDRRAVDALVSSLKDDDADVREQAAFALGQLRDARAIDGLTAALKDTNVDVRRQAAFALGQISK